MTASRLSSRSRSTRTVLKVVHRLRTIERRIVRSQLQTVFRSRKFRQPSLERQRLVNAAMHSRHVHRAFRFQIRWLRLTCLHACFASMRLIGRHAGALLLRFAVWKNDGTGEGGQLAVRKLHRQWHWLRKVKLIRGSCFELIRRSAEKETVPYFQTPTLLCLHCRSVLTVSSVF